MAVRKSSSRPHSLLIVNREVVLTQRGAISGLSWLRSRCEGRYPRSVP